MLNERLAKEMNEQVNKELFSAYLYLGMSTYYSEHGLKGFASWFKKQANEEIEHALKFVDYLQDNGVHVALSSISESKTHYEDFKEPLILQVSHEKSVTDSINNLLTIAIELKDYRSINFLNWFINEQAEEEKTAEDLLKEFELFAVDSKAVYELSDKLATRR